MLKTIIWHSFYQDSVLLMRLAAELRARAGVREVAAFMGTGANHDILEDVGLSTPESQRGGSEDLILVVEAEDLETCESAIAAAREFFKTRSRAIEEAGESLPRTLDTALTRLPEANLVSISVPGAYARYEAMRALRRGRHVFLFSDHVAIEDEVALKQEALRRGLLMMGPDCGTAYLNGTGLGFHNVVPQGRMGIVAASGTGLQAVACHLAAQGEGISQAIGVGGRDLSEEVGGAMTLFALEALAEDPASEVVILIGKLPHSSVMPRIQAALRALEKPAVVCFPGTARATSNGMLWEDTLEGAASAALSLLRRRPRAGGAFSDPAAVRVRLATIRERFSMEGRAVAGLYTGGTLAHEAHLLLKPLLGPVAFNQPPGSDRPAHWIADLGDDAYTRQRPHPMIDPEARSAAIRQAAQSDTPGVLLLDLVLGRGAHENPAAPLVSALTEAFAAAQGRGLPLIAVASVVGTSGDPQNLDDQTRQLQAAGVELLPSNAQAARFAALLVNPELEAELLGES